MILVTGATGQLGSHLLYELALKGKKIRAIFRDEAKRNTVKKLFSFYSQNGNQLLQNIEWLKADVNDYHAITSCLTGIDMVFHTAAMVSFAPGKKKNLFHVNAEGTGNIVNACLEAGNISLVHVSSIATLGELSTNEPVNENVLWNHGDKASAYSLSKYKGEMEVWRGIFEGLNAIIVNPSVIIGPGMNIGPAKQLFKSIQKGLRFYSSGSSGYVDVRDVARIMIMLSSGDTFGERFIISSGNYPHREILNLLSESFQKPLPKHKITPCMASFAVVLESIRAFLSGSEKRISMETIRIANETLKYSNKKILDRYSYEFIAPKCSIKDSVEFHNFL